MFMVGAEVAAVTISDCPTEAELSRGSNADG